MATMQDVARLANVSIATVSFTINNTKPVSPATRERVEQAMRELGFRRNAVGRALASKRTHILALLYPALQHTLSGTAMKFFTSAAATARERGYNLVLWPSSNEAEQVTELTATGLVDGALLMEVQLDDPRVVELQKGTTPFALIGRTRDPSSLPFVDIDFEGTTREAIDRLAALGHRHFALIDGGVASDALSGYGPVMRTRETFESEISARGITGIRLASDETPAAGRSAAAELRERAPEVTAVVLMNEHAAPGFVYGLADLGVGVPEDLSIISITSSPDMAAMANPELTLMTSPSTELGRMGVEAIIGQVEGTAESLPQSLVMCSYTEGASTARAR